MSPPPGLFTSEGGNSLVTNVAIEKSSGSDMAFLSWIGFNKRMPGCIGCELDDTGID